MYNVRTVRNSLTIGSLMKKTKNLDMYVSPYERYSYVCENLKLVSMPIDTLTSHLHDSLARLTYSVLLVSRTPNLHSRSRQQRCESNQWSAGLVASGLVASRMMVAGNCPRPDHGDGLS